MSAPTMEKLSDVARRIGATLRGSDAAFARVITDSRQLKAGDLFVALTGDRFDGHDYVQRAASLGAAGALVSREIEGGGAQLVVDSDTLTALQRYATRWRADFAMPVIGITGSSGKTTTKQMTAAVCAARGAVLYTEGNLNNHIGVPLTLLRLRREHATAVIEMGANHAGEIAQLAAIAKPTLGLITQAGDAHLEGFGSREGVAKAKGELFAVLAASGGTVLMNVDDAYAPLWRGLAKGASVLGFGFDPLAEVRAEDVTEIATGIAFTLRTPSGAERVALNLPGRHNVMNALAAAAAGHALGLDVRTIAAGLAKVQPVAGRLSRQVLPDGAVLIDDSYNANPTSLKAAIELLASTPGERRLVLGEMRELGPDAEAIHAQAGRDAKAAGLDRLYTLGAQPKLAAEAFGRNAQAFDTVEALVEALREGLGRGVTVLVKGSRGARMERIVEALTGRMTEGAH